MTDKDIVILSVDRSQPDIVRVNTTVEFLHCPIRFSKSLLRELGYTVYRPQKLRPIVQAAIRRQVERQGGQLPLGGFHVDDGDSEGLPTNPFARK